MMRLTQQNHTCPHHVQPQTLGSVCGKRTTASEKAGDTECLLLSREPQPRNRTCLLLLHEEVERSNPKQDSYAQHFKILPVRITECAMIKYILL